MNSSTLHILLGVLAASIIGMVVAMIFLVANYRRLRVFRRYQAAHPTLLGELDKGLRGHLLAQMKDRNNRFSNECTIAGYSEQEVMSRFMLFWAVYICAFGVAAYFLDTSSSRDFPMFVSLEVDSDTHVVTSATPIGDITGAN